ncbi:hypothetical protein N7462_009324 [Penicillium macrosclerotiorum]|uniref:uncharacterized protein n=1 Tax=Penicillium macrosclerotiorum TaxID=303699 RepID=UPI002547104C|nr:uncharacterized protein N7462_009324 [Penicillium macrosclerotiorum]KAJ5673885.1 hypothetical protein N7462_009324 [Penicillium macrosclerotiorum]
MWLRKAGNSILKAHRNRLVHFKRSSQATSYCGRHTPDSIKRRSSTLAIPVVIGGLSRKQRYKEGNHLSAPASTLSTPVEGVSLSLKGLQRSRRVFCANASVPASPVINMEQQPPGFSPGL